jgi:hypothetical protein
VSSSNQMGVASEGFARTARWRLSPSADTMGPMLTFRGFSSWACLSLLCLLSLSGAAQAAPSPGRRLAVLEFSGGNLEPDVLETFSDAVRGGALQGLAGRDITVMTRESMTVMLRDMGKLDCVEGDCEVETARNIGADFVISGNVVHIEDSYVVTLKLHECREGSLLASDMSQAPRQIQMLNQLREHARALVAALINRTRKTETSSPTETAPKTSNRKQETPPGRTAARPPGTVHAEIHSVEPRKKWEVFYDNAVICSTPCERWLDPIRPIELRTSEGLFGLGSDVVRVDRLGRAAESTGAVVVSAYPTSTGEKIGGIVMTTFAGMAVAAGAALISVGYSVDSLKGLRTPGYATAIPGLLGLAGGIWLILDSRPHATVESATLPSAKQGSVTTVMVGPGFLVGRF